MMDSLKADTLRVLKKKSFIFLNILALLVMLITGFAVGHFTEYREIYNAAMGEAVRVIVGLMVCIPIFLAVFSDDFSSKAMQTSIGFGLSRWRLILCRFFETVILYVQTYLVFSLVLIVVSFAVGNGDSVKYLLEEYWKAALIQLCYSTISMIVVYAAQSGALALVLFIILVSGTLNTTLIAMSMIPALQRHNIKPHAVLAGNMIESGKPERIVLALVIYLVVSLVVTINIFKHKELEF